MKTSSALLLAVLLVPFSGCINVSLGSRKTPPPPPIVVPSVPATSADAATIAEIDAAARLNFDSARKESLTDLARRPGLSPAAQVHLVNVAYRALSFDSAKVELLRMVIASPDFCDAARQAIVTQLNRLAFDSNRQEILRVLNQRVTTNGQA